MALGGGIDSDTSYLNGGCEQGNDFGTKSRGSRGETTNDVHATLALPQWNGWVAPPGPDACRWILRRNEYRAGSTTARWLPPRHFPDPYPLYGCGARRSMIRTYPMIVAGSLIHYTEIIVHVRIMIRISAKWWGPRRSDGAGAFMSRSLRVDKTTTTACASVLLDDSW